MYDTYIQTTEAYLYYKLTYEPKGSGELKTWSLQCHCYVEILISWQKAFRDYFDILVFTAVLWVDFQQDFITKIFQAV